MGVPFWDPGRGEGDPFQADPWDIVFMNGDPCPGLCEVKGLAQLAIDKKKAKGIDGAAITVTGYQPGPFEIVVTLWTQEQWEFFEVLLDKVWRKPAKKSKLKDVAISVSHPALDLLKINSMVIVGVTFPEPGPVPQSRVVRMKCQESVLPSKSAVVTAKKPKPVNAKLHQKIVAKNDLPKSPALTDTGPAGPPPAPARGAF